MEKLLEFLNITNIIPVDMPIGLRAKSVDKKGSTLITEAGYCTYCQCECDCSYCPCVACTPK